MSNNPRPQPGLRAIFDSESMTQESMIETMGAKAFDVSHRPHPMQAPVSLQRLFPLASFVGCADVRVVEATEHSAQCRPNVLFAAIPGTHVDGSRFAGEAVERGASALLVQQPLGGVAVPQCVVPCTRKAYSQLCAALAGYPSRRLQITGVTGTNGKTTVAWLIRSILHAAGKQIGILGTIEYDDGRHAARSGLTTPDAKTLSKWLSAMVSRGTTHAAIELSSHALDQDRTAGTHLDVAVITNVTQDHFDYHQDHESYLSSKLRIVEHTKADGRVVLNADDPGSRSLYDRIDENLNITTYGLHTGADVTAELLGESFFGSRFVLHLPGEGDGIEVCTPLIGRHNVSNCLAAAAAATHCDVEPEAIAAGMESLASVPGRLERVDCGQPFDVFVDYAHTDDALRRCVNFLRRLTQGRVICVFGAGGDRDRSKRPLLGNAAADADLAVVTSDNPRSEDPERIIDDILPGFADTPKKPHVEVDRAEAIRWALQHAESGDCVLVAGKGHEVEQIIGTERIPFDDREVIRQVLHHSGQPAIPEKVWLLA